MTPRSTGITLIELLISVVILMLLASVAIPSYQSLAAHNRIVSQTNNLVAAIHLARSEAIKRGTPVTICKRAAGRCDTTSAGWEEGFIVFSDMNQNGQRNSGETTILQSDPMAGEFRITGDGGVEKQITFNRFGGSPGSSGTLTICGSETNPVNANAINLSPAGRISLAEDGTDSDRIVENIDGDNISCS